MTIALAGGPPGRNPGSPADDAASHHPRRKPTPCRGAGAPGAAQEPIPALPPGGTRGRGAAHGRGAPSWTLRQPRERTGTQAHAVPAQRVTTKQGVAHSPNKKGGRPGPASATHTAGTDGEEGPALPGQPAALTWLPWPAGRSGDPKGGRWFSQPVQQGQRMARRPLPPTRAGSLGAGKLITASAPRAQEPHMGGPQLSGSAEVGAGSGSPPRPLSEALQKPRSRRKGGHAARSHTGLWLPGGISAAKPEPCWGLRGPARCRPT